MSANGPDIDSDEDDVDFVLGLVFSFFPNIQAGDESQSEEEDEIEEPETKKRKIDPVY